MLQASSYHFTFLHPFPLCLRSSLFSNQYYMSVNSNYLFTTETKFLYCFLSTFSQQTAYYPCVVSIPNIIMLNIYVHTAKIHYWALVVLCDPYAMCEKISQTCHEQGNTGSFGYCGKYLPYLFISVIQIEHIICTMLPQTHTIHSCWLTEDIILSICFLL